MNNRLRRVRIGLALVLGATLVPAGAMAQDYGGGGMGSGGQMMRPAGEHRPMPAPPPHGMAAGHHMAPDHHMAPEAAHAMAPGHVKKKDTGIVEGGFGSSDNSGGSVVGADAVPGHGHGDNAGGNIH